MPNYILSPNAARSITEINKFTIEKFGERQARRYLENFRDRFRFLVENPLLGRKRNDLEEGYYSYFEGSHTIYYKILGENIAIIDVLHQSMEPGRHLSYEL